MTNGLQSKVAKMQDVELEVKQLRETLAEYNEEFRQVRNQGKQLNLKKQRDDDLLSPSSDRVDNFFPPYFLVHSSNFISSMGKDFLSIIIIFEVKRR